MSEAIPTMSEAIPTMSEAIPTMSEAIPTMERNYLRSRSSIQPMRTLPFFAASLILACVCVFGQTADNLTFEVASVKRTPPAEPNARVFFGPPRGGPGTSDPGQITWTNAALRNILMTAYDVQTYQVTAPDWMNTERYDIAAKVPTGATKTQVNVMWQNLLKERFGMVLHHESKDFQVEELTVAKGGSKLKETSDPNIEGFTPAAGPPKLDKNGFPEMNGSGAIFMIFVNANNPTARMIAKALPSSDIATRLADSYVAPSSTRQDSLASTISLSNILPTCRESASSRSPRSRRQSQRSRHEH